jgi:hypothetical protein
MEEIRSMDIGQDPESGSVITRSQLRMMVRTAKGIFGQVGSQAQIEKAKQYLESNGEVGELLSRSLLAYYHFDAGPHPDGPGLEGSY